MNPSRATMLDRRMGDRKSRKWILQSSDSCTHCDSQSKASISIVRDGASGVRVDQVGTNVMRLVVAAGRAARLLVFSIMERAV